MHLIYSQHLEVFKYQVERRRGGRERTRRPPPPPTASRSPPLDTAASGEGGRGAWRGRGMGGGGRREGGRRTRWRGRGQFKHFLFIPQINSSLPTTLSPWRNNEHRIGNNPQTRHAIWEKRGRKKLQTAFHFHIWKQQDGMRPPAIHRSDTFSRAARRAGRLSGLPWSTSETSSARWVMPSSPRRPSYVYIHTLIFVSASSFLLRLTIHIWMCSKLHSYIHTCLYTYVQTTHTSLHVCLHTYINRYKHT